MSATRDVDPQFSAILAVSLAYAGRGAEGIGYAERAVALPTHDRSKAGYMLYLLARTYSLAGQPEKAIDALERVVRPPASVTGAQLGIDPTWKSLRGNPRFERLVRGG
jgi:hypothetical protein